MSVWECESGRGKWSGLDAATSEALRKASAPFVDAAAGLTLDPVAMSQKNDKTGFRKRLRVLVKPADKTGESEGQLALWEWADDRGGWASFGHDASQTLERVLGKGKDRATGQAVLLTIAGRDYALDPWKLYQENRETKVRRPIRRSLLKPGEVAPRDKPPKVEQPAEAKPNGASSEPPRRSGRSKSAKAPANGSSSVKEEPKEAEEEKPKKLSKSAVAQSEAKSTKRKLVVRGRAALDGECSAMAGKAHVYEEGADVYDAMLNQTNLQNNNNKYYLIQLLEADAGKAFHVWMRWGRVGFKGQSSLVSCGSDLEQAKGIFCQKFADKTRNEWGARAKFAKVNGKYDLVQVDYSAGDDQTTSSKKPKAEAGEEEDAKPPVESKLPEAVQGIMKLICDVRRMEAAVKELEYDAEKAPLGKLTTAQINAGYAALKKIEQVLDGGKSEHRKLLEATNEYYTRIPHAFGMRTPPLIRDMKQLRRELELMEALADIEVAVRTIASGKSEHGDLHPVDANYAAMKCGLTPLDEESESYRLIAKYLANTHGPTHNLYKMRVRNVFAVAKEGEKEAFRSGLAGRKLLWHGSRLTNWFGILSQGLRIAPPEAPVTGYMFGKGVYFADVSSKSANYCFPSKKQSRGLLLLADVATGNPEVLHHAKYDAGEKLAEGCDSVFAKGSLVPDPAKRAQLDGAEVPLGKVISAPTTASGGYSLNYNEYVVYKTDQLRMAYVVETDFVF